MKPIVFNTHDVKSIQDGKKTQTRRLINPQPRSENSYYGGEVISSTNKSLIGCVGFCRSPLAVCDHDYRRPPYQTGDVLYVRETWTCIRNVFNAYEEDYFYAAIQFDYNTVSTTCLCDDDGFETGKPFPWKSPLSMPKKLARLFLLVTDVKAQRLQDITPRDAWDEGCRIGQYPWGQHLPEIRQMCVNNAFKLLWNTAHPKDGWNTNPWVWVIGFKQTEKPEVVE